MYQLTCLKAGSGLILACALALSLGFASGCGNEAVPKESSETPPPVANPSMEALAALELADAADGTTDKVVNQCVSCKLLMVGKPEYATSYGEYELHLCSEHCKQFFVKDPEKALFSLNQGRESSNAGALPQ